MRAERTEFERVDEAGTRRDQIEPPGVLGAEAMLNQAGRGGEHHVGRDGANQDGIELQAVDAPLSQSSTRRFDSHVRRSDLRRGDVALRNPHPLQDPFIAGLDHFFEIVIGEHSRGRVTA